MVLLLLLMMLKRALSLPSSCRCGGISEGRFFHHQVSGGKISLNLRKSDLSSCIVKKKAFSSPPPPSFGKEKRTKKTKAREKSTFDHRSRERERELKEIGLRSLFLRSTQHS